MRTQRAMTALIVTSVLALTACSDDSDDDSDAPVVMSELGVEVAGEVGEEPTLTIPDAEPEKELKVEVLSEGDGPEVSAEDVVVANYLGQTWEPRPPGEATQPGEAAPSSEATPSTPAPSASPSTEEEADAEPYVFDTSYALDSEEQEDEVRNQPRGFSLDGVIPGWKEGLSGQKVGSRILMSIPPDQAYGPVDGHDLQGDTLVFVVDIIKAVDSNAAASGEPVSDLPEGLPTVEGAEGEAPTIDFAGATPPEASDSTLLIAGDGEELAENLVINLVQASYPDGVDKISTWAEGEQPITLASAQLEGIPGLPEALEGQKIGSRVMTRIAPADNPGEGGQPGPALVLVLDVIDSY